MLFAIFLIYFVDELTNGDYKFIQWLNRLMQERYRLIKMMDFMMTIEHLRESICVHNTML